MVLSEDQRALQETARRFARERLLPDYQEAQRIGTLDRQLVAEMGRLGLLGMDLPEELGGMGADAVTTGLIAEELAYGDFNISAVPVGISLNAAILLRHAQPDVVREWVPRMTRGDAVVAICPTEPRGGSDASNLQLRARRDGDHYVINGEKTSITFADRADAYLVFARTGKPEEGAKGVSAFFIPYEGTTGIAHLLRRCRQRDHRPRLGVLRRRARTCDPPPERRRQGLHAGDAGFRLQPRADRPAMCRRGAGVARRSLGLREGARGLRPTDRAVPGRELSARGVRVAHRRRAATVLHALALRDAGQPHTAEAAMCKWMGPKTAFDTIHQCLLTFGHYGWSKDLPHQQRLRDVMGLEIGDGTAAVMKLIIARERIGRVAVQYDGRDDGAWKGPVVDRRPDRDTSGRAEAKEYSEHAIPIRLSARTLQGPDRYRHRRRQWPRPLHGARARSRWVRMWRCRPHAGEAGGREGRDPGGRRQRQRAPLRHPRRGSRITARWTRSSPYAAASTAWSTTQAASTAHR